MRVKTEIPGTLHTNVLTNTVKARVEVFFFDGLLLTKNFKTEDAAPNADRESYRHGVKRSG